MLTSKKQVPLSSKFLNHSIHTFLNAGSDTLLVLILKRGFDHEQMQTATKPEEAFILYIYLP